MSCLSCSAEQRSLHHCGPAIRAAHTDGKGEERRAAQHSPKTHSRFTFACYPDQITFLVEVQMITPLHAGGPKAPTRPILTSKSPISMFPSVRLLQSFRAWLLNEKLTSYAQLCIQLCKFRLTTHKDDWKCSNHLLSFSALCLHTIMLVPPTKHGLNKC